MTQTKKEFRVGDRVWYTSGKHKAGKSDPLKGTKYECVGTIIFIHTDMSPADDYPINVQWDNHRTNAYKEEDLTHATGKDALNDPN